MCHNSFYKSVHKKRDQSGILGLGLGLGLGLIATALCSGVVVGRYWSYFLQFSYHIFMIGIVRLADSPQKAAIS